ncbi:NAD(P)H-dependent oxidoreductase [Streptomyces caniscabiei]|uniref:NAD(P)H-dependent oxidoreductase n=1 Tax=Streptomyces caniscabiei TaxID=2746961 RepID=A0A927LF18_9ACTN|nr:NAD(P)H-dependent oxidoreductase [Streptomyces caniscabiei]MBD9729906.1 NAD(P)H-dependent oxidoreductase [Streptomyces caniscabiei]MDX3515569.1 NAD(P)H-dependent oxidoreductase [Streptomyces caniscabiei]MDX3724825.1 NAD(P)H-dependent oxidoreductase [Streptomyces caniscabiei]WEO21733.1 NAD(P)H-dependent oxidoreductase [Streptomyces caniscabiei]
MRAEVEVLELHRLAADLAQYSAQGRAGLDLRETIAAVVTADGLVVATPVLAASPSEVFDSFFAVLEDKVLSGMPVLLALDSGSRRQPSGLARVMCRRLTGVHADPVPTVVVAGPADWQATALSDAGGCAPVPNGLHPAVLNPTPPQRRLACERTLGVARGQLPMIKGSSSGRACRRHGSRSCRVGAPAGQQS